MFIHRTLPVVFVQVLLSEVDDDVLFSQKVGNRLPEVTVEPPTRAIGTCFLIILSQWWLMVAALTEARFGTIAHPSFVAWHGSTVFMVPDLCLHIGSKMRMFENRGRQYIVILMGKIMIIHWNWGTQFSIGTCTWAQYYAVINFRLSNSIH